MSSSQHGERSPQVTLLQYYEQRYSEYEAIYMKPEHQQNLDWLESQISSLIAGKRVLKSPVEPAIGQDALPRLQLQLRRRMHLNDWPRLLK